MGKGNHYRRAAKSKDEQIMTAQDLENRDRQEQEQEGVNNKAKYHYFWQNRSPFSQWHMSKYTLD